MRDRRSELLDAAVRVLGRDGLRQLTHRAVDAEAGLPMGSTSNAFRTRDALVRGVLGHLAAAEAAAFARLAGPTRPVDPDQFAAWVAELLRHLLGPARTWTLARRALFAEAAGRPDLRREILEQVQPLWDGAAAWLRELGSQNPAQHARVLFALMEGLLDAGIVHADAPAIDLEDAVRVLLRGMLAGPAPPRPGRAHPNPG
jgi:DNA-binding transcriptional regulator YbjK